MNELYKGIKPLIIQKHPKNLHIVNSNLRKLQQQLELSDVYQEGDYLIKTFLPFLM